MSIADLQCKMILVDLPLELIAPCQRRIVSICPLECILIMVWINVVKIINRNIHYNNCQK
jgi:hypothetical protein